MSNIDQNNNDISLSSIDEETSVIYEDIEEDISDPSTNFSEKDIEINNEDEELQYNKTFDLTEDLSLNHYKESESSVDEYDDHSSTYQSLHEDCDQLGELLDEDSSDEYGIEDNEPSFIDKSEGASLKSNLRPRRVNVGKGVEKLKMSLDGKHYPSISRKKVLILKENNINEEEDSYFYKAIEVMFMRMSTKEGIK